ncbi:MAG: FecR domain-containing protein [Gammaproteobacteria bacterium]
MENFPACLDAALSSHTKLTAIAVATLREPVSEFFEPIKRLIHLGRAQARLPSSWPAAYGIAWAVVLVLSLIAFWLHRAQVQVYRTHRGGQQRIVLSDRSIIELNTSTVATVRMGAHWRRVTLVAGEAAFEANSDGARPFQVIAGKNVVTAIGTQFLLRRWDDGRLDVLVERGHVGVGPVATVNQRPLPPPALTLYAPSFANFSANGQLIKVQEASKGLHESKTAWRSGLFRFESETLQTVVAEFNRYNRKQLAIADPSIASLRIGGTFETTSPDNFVQGLAPLGIAAQMLVPARPGVMGSKPDQYTIRLFRQGPQSQSGSQVGRSR